LLGRDFYLEEIKHQPTVLMFIFNASVFFQELKHASRVKFLINKFDKNPTVMSGGSRRICDVIMIYLDFLYS